MTLDPAEVAEAWCHQRGYVCLIEELHRRARQGRRDLRRRLRHRLVRRVKAMEKVYDRYKGKSTIRLEADTFTLE